MTQGFPVLLPRPVEVVPGDGAFALVPDATLRLEMGAADAPRLRRALARLPVPLLPMDGPAAVTVRLRPGAHPLEGYRLDVGSDGIAIEAAEATGAIHAVSTLMQLLPPAALRRRPPDGTAWLVPACRIADAPRFAWRGALLDVARHFLPRHEVMRQIDAMAAHKLNRLQLHLTDEQGWRVESKRFPRLTAVGASRERTQLSHWDEAEKRFDEVPHGGFYTQEDLREIHDHAADRGILLVPEISLPAHTGALLAAYPEFGSPKVSARPMVGTFGLHDTVLAPTEATFAFLDALLGEVMDVLPGGVVHLGADESVIAPWATDPEVRAYAASRGLGSPAEILADFVGRVEAMVVARGRRPVTWDDAFSTGALAARAADPSRIVMAWRGDEVARRAAAAGHDVVMTPMVRTYLNFDEGNDAAEPISAGGPVTVEDVAGWSPVPAGWSEAEAARVIGVQFQLWTEFCNSPRKADYMLYPRLCAGADLAWTGRPSTGEAARACLSAHLPRLDAMGVEYRPPGGPRPWQRGGAGREAHRPAAPLSEVLRSHAEAALRGEIPVEHGVNATLPAEA